MTLPREDSNLERARQLRRCMTREEKHLWYDYLQRYPVKLYKQRIIGPYIADFYCASAKLVIEIDGMHHYMGEDFQYDERRRQYMESYGLEVLRFTNVEVKTMFASVCQVIDKTIQRRRRELEESQGKTGR